MLLYIINGTVNVKKGWWVTGNVAYIFNNYGIKGMQNSPLIISPAIGKKIGKLKLFELKLSGFDILDQNKNTANTLSNSFVQNTRSNTISRYFMFSAKYTIRRTTKI